MNLVSKSQSLAQVKKHHTARCIATLTFLSGSGETGLWYPPVMAEGTPTPRQGLGQDFGTSDRTRGYLPPPPQGRT